MFPTQNRKIMRNLQDALKCVLSHYYTCIYMAANTIRARLDAQCTDMVRISDYHGTKQWE